MNTTAVRSPVAQGSAPGVGTRGMVAARAVSAALAVVMAIAAAVGLAGGDSDQVPDSAAAMLRGYDLIALTVAVPLLVAALLRRTARSVLVWAGVLVYGVYTYAFETFGMAAVSAAYGLPLVAVALSITGLVLLATNAEVRTILAGYGRPTSARLVSGVLVVLGVSLAGMWISLILPAVGGGGQGLSEPSELVLPVQFTRVGAALDLALLVPGYLLAGVLLWRRAPSGYLVATPLLLAGVIQQVAYMTALVFQATMHVPGATGFDPVEPVILAAFAAALAMMLWPEGRTGGVVDRRARIQARAVSLTPQADRDARPR